ncbi:MAG: ribosome maturation factor RimM [Actinomycetes bacterium]
MTEHEEERMEVVVARIGRPHGVRGELSVEVRTDVPEQRFVVGARFTTDPGGRTLTLVGVRDHNGRTLLTFAEVSDRTAAEAVRDVLLVAEVAETDEPDAWPAASLVGLRAVTVDGRDVGTVVGLEHLPAQDLLEIEQPSGHRALVPFVAAIVPEVDVEGGRVVLDPPGGLLEG